MNAEMAPKVRNSQKQLHEFMAIQARLVRARAGADIVEREAIEVAFLRDYNMVYSNEAGFGISKFLERMIRQGTGR